jgi:hypothetical protein
MLWFIQIVVVNAVNIINKCIPVWWYKRQKSRWIPKTIKKSSPRVFRLRAVKFKQRMLLCSLLISASSKSGPMMGDTDHMYDRTDTLAYTSSSRLHKHPMGFDTNSFEIKIDNCCTRTMSHCKSDIIAKTMKPVRNLAKGQTRQ